MTDLESFILRDKVEDAVIEAGGWENVADGNYWGAKLPAGMKIVEKDLDEAPDEMYGEHSQGHEGVCFVVIEHEGRFFRKTGTTDSYATRNWGGTFREVQKGQVEVVKYEWMAV